MKAKNHLFHKAIFSVNREIAQRPAKNGISVDQATRSKYQKKACKKDFWDWLDWDVETEIRGQRPLL